LDAEPMHNLFSCTQQSKRVYSLAGEHITMHNFVKLLKHQRNTKIGYKN